MFDEPFDRAAGELFPVGTRRECALATTRQNAGAYVRVRLRKLDCVAELGPRLRVQCVQGLRSIKRQDGNAIGLLSRDLADGGPLEWQRAK